MYFNTDLLKQSVLLRIRQNSSYVTALFFLLQQKYRESIKSLEKLLLEDIRKLWITFSKVCKFAKQLLHRKPSSSWDCNANMMYSLWSILLLVWSRLVSEKLFQYSFCEMDSCSQTRFFIRNNSTKRITIHLTSCDNCDFSYTRKLNPSTQCSQVKAEYHLLFNTWKHTTLFFICFMVEIILFWQSGESLALC